MTQKRIRLYLINPRFKYKHYAAQQEMARLLGKKKMTVPVQLPLIAALTPPHYEIRIIDEETDPLILDPVPDLVGITTLSSTIDRVSEIAAQYAKLGATVVLGGPFASLRTEEALEIADHVIVGEAEGAWQRFLEDFERGEARKVYQNAQPPPFRRSPIPRWDLAGVTDAMTVGVETSRGCPFTCDFCIVNKMFGRKMRFREIDDLIREIEAAPVKRIFFVADNFALRKSYARALVRRLKPLGITWICQTSIHVADDITLLKEMADAGCVSVLIGFESLNAAALEDVKKYHNHIEEFERAIRKIHAVGIHVLASFIVGFDEDTLETFDVITDFVERNNLVFPMLNVMSVAPGTAIYERMEAAGRIAAVEPAYRNGIFPCIHYNNISQRAMLDRFFEALTELFDWDRLLLRSRKLFSDGFFSRPSPEKVPLTDKLSASAYLLRRFLLSKNRTKRRLFLELWTLARRGRLAPDKMVLFLLNMEAFNIFLEDAKGYLDEVRGKVDAIDQGPWAKQRGSASHARATACSVLGEPTELPRGDIEGRV